MRTLWVCAAAAAAMMAAAFGSAAPADADQRTCKPVRAEGRSVAIYATSLDCGKARRIAAAFLRHGRFTRGWTAVNPAGWEWVMMRRRDKQEVVSDGYQGGPGRPTINFTGQRGCNS
jgi:hypothetical protein